MNIFKVIYNAGPCGRVTETHQSLFDARRACCICNAHDVKNGYPALHSVDGEVVTNPDGLNLTGWVLDALGVSRG
jgi:hypothetical protein